MIKLDHVVEFVFMVLLPILVVAAVISTIVNSFSVHKIKDDPSVEYFIQRCEEHQIPIPRRKCEICQQVDIVVNLNTDGKIYMHYKCAIEQLMRDMAKELPEKETDLSL